MIVISVNLTFPLAAWFMHANELKRGLLGHVSKGYDEAHINPELRQATATHRLKPLTQQPA